MSRLAARCGWTGAAKAPALVFLSDKGHPQWAGALSLERQAELIAGAVGLSGRNVDYLRDLVEHLRAEGIRDEGMERLLRMVGGLATDGGV